MSFATVVMAFASCEQVVEESVPQNDFVYTFTLGSADETKATIGENSVVWEEGDQMGVYTISTSGTSYNRYGDITPGTPATMEISSYYALAAGDMVYAYYPYTSNNSKEATTVSMSIPTSQDGKDDMPMVSLPIAMASDLEEKTDMNLPAGELKFVNLAAVIEFNVYSTTAEYQSEKIQSVSFVADQAIAGSFTYDLSKVNYSDPATLTISGYEETTVVYTPSTPAPVPAEKASATKIKMVVAPGSYTGKVIVTTDAATYTYNIEAAKEFVRSTIKPLNVELRAGVREPIPVQPSGDKQAIINVDNVNAAQEMGNGSYGDYKDKTVSITVDGLPCIAKNICANSKDGTLKMAAKQFIQMKASTGLLYNTEGKVKSIKVWTHPNKDKADFIYVGSSAAPNVKAQMSVTTENVQLKDNNDATVSTTLNVYEVDLGSENSYFQFKSSGALWIYKVVVTYTE